MSARSADRERQRKYAKQAESRRQHKDKYARPVPTCNNCGGPWFEPENGVLRCCDCGTEFGKDGSR